MARIFWPQLRVALLGAILLLDITQHHQSQASPSKPDFSTFTIEQACDQMTNYFHLAFERHLQLLKQSEAAEDKSTKVQLKNDAETLLKKANMWKENFKNFTERVKNPEDKLSETDQQMIQDMYNELKALGLGKLKIIKGTIQEIMALAMSRTSLYIGIYSTLSSSSKDEVFVNAADDKVKALWDIQDEFVNKYAEDVSKYKEKPVAEDVTRLQNAIDEAKEAVQKMLDAQSREKQNEVPTKPANKKQGLGQSQHPAADQNVKSGVLKRLGHFAKKKSVWIPTALSLTAGLVYYGGHHFLGGAGKHLVNQTKSVAASNLQFEADNASSVAVKKKSSSSWWLAVAITILVVAVLAGAAYFFIKKGGQPGFKSSASKSNSKSTSRSTSATTV